MPRAAILRDILDLDRARLDLIRGGTYLNEHEREADAQRLLWDVVRLRREVTHG